MNAISGGRPVEAGRKTRKKKKGNRQKKRIPLVPVKWTTVISSRKMNE